MPARRDARGQRPVERRGRAAQRFPGSVSSDYDYVTTERAAERLRAGAPQRAARDVRGVRLPRPEPGRRQSQYQHRGAAGAVSDEHPFVRAQAEAAARRCLALRFANRQDDDPRDRAGILADRRRAPSAAERQIAARRSAPERILAEGSSDAADAAAGERPARLREAAYADLFQMLFSSLDFRYRD